MLHTLTNEDLSLLLGNFMQALLYTLFCFKIVGFMLLEAGYVRGKNRVNVTIRFMITLLVTVIFYGFIGVSIYYGRPMYEVLYDGNGGVNYPAAMDLYAKSMLVLTSLVIMSGACSERIKTSAHFIFIICMALFIFPFLLRLVGNGDIIDYEGWLTKIGYYDVYKISVIHGVAGASGLALTLFLGPRVGRFDKDSKTRFHANDPTFSSVGVALIWLGWYGYLGVTSPETTIYNPILVGRCMVSGCFGSFSALVLCFVLKKGKFRFRPIFLGFSAGLVAATGGITDYSIIQIIIASTLGGVSAYLTMLYLIHLKIDDVVDSIAAFFPSAFLSMIFPVLFLHDVSPVFLEKSIGESLFIQIFGYGLLCTIGAGGAYLLLYILNFFIKFRVSPEAEKVGLGISEHETVSEASSLLTSMQHQASTGQFSEPIVIDSDSDISQVGEMYNNVVKQLEEISAKERNLRIHLEDTNQHLSIQRNITQQLNLSSNLESGLAQCLPKIIRAYEYTGMRVSFLEGDELRILSSAWIYNRELYVNREFEGGERDGPWCLETRGIEPVVNTFANNLLRQADYPEIAKYNLHSVLIQPIIVKSKLKGIIETFSYKDLKDEIMESPVEESLIRSMRERITQDDYNNSLKKALEKAEANNKAQAEFLAMMSHEIRTPMNGVLGTCGLLVTTGLKERQLEFANDIKDSAESLLVVINDILDFSKYQSDSFALASVDFNLEEVLEGIITNMRQRVRVKKLDLICSIDKRIPVVLNGDSTRLRQIILNIVSNAVKFTNEGEISLNAWNDKREGDSVTIKFQISDTGIGVPEEALPTLFQSFSQVDTSSTRQYGGTGLGLAISKRLVDYMGGEISVSSDQGKGSVFTFSVKLKTAADKDLLRKRLKSEKSLKEKIKGKSVLVSENNYTSLEMTRNLLNQWGASVIHHTEKDNINTFLEEQPSIDLAVLSFKDGVENGLETAYQIRENEEYKDLPILLQSSNSKEFLSSLVGNKPSPVTGLLEKPYTPSKLLETIASTGKHTSEGGSKALALEVVSKPSTKLRANPKFGKKYPARMLVVDDNKMNRKLTSAILESWGYKPDVVNDGAEALAVATEKDYDVIFMDVEMPIMDGLTATKKIRKLPKEKLQPLIVAITAAAMPGDREKCLDSGMDDYLTKPLDSNVIYKMVFKHRKFIREAGEKNRDLLVGAENKERKNIAQPSVREQPKTIEENEVKEAPKEIQNAKSFDAELIELKKLIGDDKAQLVNFIAPFVKELEEYSTSLRLDLVERKFDHVRRVFHSLKTNAKIFGAPGFSEMSSELEQLAKNEDVSGMENKLGRFSATLTAFKNHLSALIEEFKKEI